MSGRVALKVLMASGKRSASQLFTLLSCGCISESLHQLLVRLLEILYLLLNRVRLTEAKSLGELLHSLLKRSKATGEIAHFLRSQREGLTCGPNGFGV